MNKLSPNTGESKPDVVDVIRGLVASLEDGGPPVNEQLIEEYVCGALDSGQAQGVAAKVMKWRSWYQTELEIRCQIIRRINSDDEPSKA